MGNKKSLSADNISKGMLIRKIGDDSGEFYKVGDFYPDRGWELRPRGKDTLNSSGVLIYLSPERVERYELLDD